LSFTIAVRQGLALNQLRLATGTSTLTDDEIRDLHAYDPVLTRGDRAIPSHALATGGGLFLGLDLRGDEHRRVGYSAKEYAPVLEADRVGAFDPEAFWEPVVREPGDRI